MPRNSKTKQAWADMKQRCTNPSCRKFEIYGALGISFVAEWRTLEGFIADMGEAPEGACLDRIDNSKGYSKENCRWISKKESARNTKRIKLDVPKVRIIKALLRAVNPAVKRITAYFRIAPLFGVTWHTI